MVFDVAVLAGKYLRADTLNIIQKGRSGRDVRECFFGKV